MNNKADILKQIDDAASQYGGQAASGLANPSVKSRRDGMAKMTGQMVMDGQRGGLSGKDLASLNENKFKHQSTLLGHNGTK